MAYRSKTRINLLEVVKYHERILDEQDYIPCTDYYVNWNTYRIEETIYSRDGWPSGICHKSTRPLREHFKIKNPNKGHIHDLPTRIYNKLL